MKKVLLILILLYGVYADELKRLLNLYAQKSKLSNITKVDSAGILEIIDQEQIHASQARTLKDLLKGLSIIHYAQTPNNMDIFLFGSGSYLSPSFVRFYINDHDLSSASFGSALLIWGDMPVELIDHIEVYKGSSSIEFGNEVGMLVVRVYTKLPEREEDQKVRVTKDSQGGGSLEYYYAHTLADDRTLFLYGGGVKENREDLNHDGFRIDRDKKEGSFYLRYKEGKWKVESGYLTKRSDPFFGLGKHYHPTGGGLKAYHGYFALQRLIANGSIEVSYDRLHYDRLYQDAEGVYTAQGYVKRYYIRFEDEIYSLAAKKYFYMGSSTLLIGGFLKKKEVESKGRFDAKRNDWSNNLYQGAFYLEERYDVTPSFTLIASAKVDDYRYKHGNSGLYPTIRLGAIYKEKEWMAKIFATRIAIPPEIYKFYTKENLPFRPNEQLHFRIGKVVAASVDYKDEHKEIFGKGGVQIVKNRDYFDPRYGGYQTSHQRVRNAFVEVGGRYYLDDNNWIYLDLSKEKNSKMVLSPSFKAIVRLYNSWDNWELYNSLIYYSSYIHRYQGGRERVDGSLCYSAAVRYKIGEDFSIGVRGDNIFDDGFKWGYRKIAGAYPVTDRRFMVNMEYQF